MAADKLSSFRDFVCGRNGTDGVKATSVLMITNGPRPHIEQVGSGKQEKIPLGVVALFLVEKVLHSDGFMGAVFSTVPHIIK